METGSSFAPMSFLTPSCGQNGKNAGKGQALKGIFGLAGGVGMGHNRNNVREEGAEDPHRNGHLALWDFASLADVTGRLKRETFHVGSLRRGSPCGVLLFACRQGHFPGSRRPRIGARCFAGSGSFHGQGRARGGRATMKNGIWAEWAAVAVSSGSGEIAKE